MPDEKRIKDFEPATEILNDDWFAVDSPSQGTRKMQASMFQAGLQNQITANRDDIDLQSGQISVLQQAVGNIGDKVDVLDAAITVEEYSATKLYSVDEDCVYEGVRYKCITAIETPEAFTPSHWQAISIEGELNELNSSLTQLTTGTMSECLSKTADLTIGSQNKVLYLGNRTAQVTIVFILSASKAQGSELCELPITMRIAGLFPIRNDTGETYVIGNVQDGQKVINAISSLPSGNYRGSFTYITV